MARGQGTQVSSGAAQRAARRCEPVPHPLAAVEVGLVAQQADRLERARAAQLLMARAQLRGRLVVEGQAAGIHLGAVALCGPGARPGWRCHVEAHEAGGAPCLLRLHQLLGPIKRPASPAHKLPGRRCQCQRARVAAVSSPRASLWRRAALHSVSPVSTTAYVRGLRNAPPTSSFRMMSTPAGRQHCVRARGGDRHTRETHAALQACAT